MHKDYIERILRSKMPMPDIYWFNMNNEANLKSAYSNAEQISIGEYLSLMSFAAVTQSGAYGQEAWINELDNALASHGFVYGSLDDDGEFLASYGWILRDILMAYMGAAWGDNPSHPRHVICQSLADCIPEFLPNPPSEEVYA